MAGEKFRSKYFEQVEIFDTVQLEITFHADLVGSTKVITSAEIRHKGLDKHRKISGDTADIIEQKTALQAKQWDVMWQALQGSKEASAALERSRNILHHTLKADRRLDWDSLKNMDEFPVARPELLTLPRPPELIVEPPRPLRIDPKYEAKLSGWASVLPSAKRKKEDEAMALYQRDIEEWNKVIEEIERKNWTQREAFSKEVERAKLEHRDALASWEDEKQAYWRERDAANASIDRLKSEYLSKLPAAVVEFCQLVLTHLQYPDSFPKEFGLDYNPDNRLLIVNYSLPSLEEIPSTKDVKYNARTEELVQVRLPEREMKKLYDDIIYQITLGTIHKLCEADEADTLDLVVFNGRVKAIDRATGKRVSACILSVQVNKKEFLEIDLENVDPKICFKKLKGVCASQLHSLTPIAPILDFNKDDKRFVEAYEVVKDVDSSTNLAAMDWEDFEHLVRELFEKEFSQSGGEVKVTQASRDGGVDAIAFDPDPIRGGKIVIQAKRYTNTVGVSAVRDLYGTVMNEGATKGILVTTTDYGPDAYEFVRGKPLTLLNGNNLLHLLEKHGHKARIDIGEARRILSSEGGTPL